MAYPAFGGKPQFHEFITPVGQFVHVNHDRPMMMTHEHTKQPLLDDKGIQRGEYKVTLMWEKNRIPELQELIALAQKVKGEAWPESLAPGAFFALQPFFRDGDNPEHNTKKKEYLFGKHYLNFKQKADAQRNPQTGEVVYAGAPGLVDMYGNPMMPLDLYGGCWGRASGIMFGTEYMGKNFISVRLNNIQKGGGPSGDGNGERIGGGGRPDPTSQFGSLAPAGAAGGFGALGGMI